MLKMTIMHGALMMRVPVLVAALFCFPMAAHADEILLEGGVGVYKSNNSEAVFLRYQKDSSPLFGLDSYYNLALASWSGPTHNDAVILTKGIRWDLIEKTYFGFEAGGAYLKRTTENLGTRAQFAFRFALGLKAGAFDLALGYNHFSNGKAIFQWTKSANLWENFLMLGIGYVF